MFRALYDFSGSTPQSLTMRAGQGFTVMDTSDSHWYLVQNGVGMIGYVPANYLEKETVSESAELDVLQSIDHAIKTVTERISKNKPASSSDDEATLRKLVQHRHNMCEEFLAKKSTHTSMKQSVGTAPSSIDVIPSTVSPTHSQRRRAPDPPGQKSPVLTSSNILSPLSPLSPQAPPGKCLVEHHSEPRTVSHPHCSNTDTMNMKAKPVYKQNSPSPKVKRKTSFEMLTPSPRKTNTNIHIPDSMANDLVELLRRNTGLSHEKSKTAAATVLMYLKENVSALNGPFDSVLRSLHKGDISPLEISQDASRLHTLFAEMSACKEDSQQRSWALHEDELTITQNLEEMLSILTLADPSISREMVAQDNYNAVHTLVLYYQMETRVLIRMVLLQIFGALCSLDKHVLSELLTSVLPLELARDMQSDVKDTAKLRHSTLVLTMIFSMGESVPIHHYDHLSRLFIRFLLDTIESSPSTWDEQEADDLIDLFIRLILAFNLHFEMPSNNPVMAVLAEYETAKVFTEKVMLLINRGEDPIRFFDYDPKPPDSLLKFMMDLFSSCTTAGLLYTNDAMVLIDIVSRQLSDLSAGDRMRTEYLSLVHLILKNSSYEEHQHKKFELGKIFQQIMNEQDSDFDQDQMIIKQIYKDFSTFFS